MKARRLISRVSIVESLYYSTQYLADKHERPQRPPRRIDPPLSLKTAWALEIARVVCDSILTLISCIPCSSRPRDPESPSTVILGLAAHYSFHRAVPLRTRGTWRFCVHCPLGPGALTSLRPILTGRLLRPHRIQAVITSCSEPLVWCATRALDSTGLQTPGLHEKPPVSTTPQQPGRRTVDSLRLLH